MTINKRYWWWIAQKKIIKEELQYNNCLKYTPCIMLVNIVML